MSGLPIDGRISRIFQDRDGIDGDEAAERDKRRGEARAEIPHPAVANRESQREQTAESNIVGHDPGEEPYAALNAAAHKLRLFDRGRRIFAFRHRGVMFGLRFRLVHRAFKGDGLVDRGFAYRLQ